MDYKKLLDETRNELSYAKASLNTVTESIKTLATELGLPIDANLPNVVNSEIVKCSNSITELEGKLNEEAKKLEELLQ